MVGVRILMFQPSNSKAIRVSLVTKKLSLVLVQFRGQQLCPVMDKQSPNRSAYLYSGQEHKPFVT